VPTKEIVVIALPWREECCTRARGVDSVVLRIFQVSAGAENGEDQLAAFEHRDHARQHIPPVGLKGESPPSKNGSDMDDNRRSEIRPSCFFISKHQRRRSTLRPRVRHLARECFERRRTLYSPKAVRLLLSPFREDGRSATQEMGRTAQGGLIRSAVRLAFHVAAFSVTLPSKERPFTRRPLAGHSRGGDFTCRGQSGGRTAIP
jgi:hypothetical protein